MFALAACLNLVPAVGFAQPAPPADPAQQAAAQGTELFNQGRYADSAAAFEQFLKEAGNAGTGVVGDVRRRLAQAYLMAKQYDKAIDNLKQVLAMPPDRVPPEVTEIAMSLIPDAYAAKAAAMKPEEAGRDKMFRDAITAYDAFITKYPQNPSIGDAIYGRATAYFQLKEFAEAAKFLQEYLQRGPNPDIAQDAQFLYAVALSSAASETLRGRPTPDEKAAAATKLDQAEKVLQAIIQRREDLALANDCLFQLGETYYLHAQTQTDEASKDERAKLLQKAKEAFGQVQAKEPIIAMQKRRIDQIRAQIPEVIRQITDPAQRNAQVARLDRILQREQAKLEQLQQKAPPTLAAQIRMGEILFQDQKYDEVRVLFNYLLPLTTTDEEKKSLAFHVAMTYALQAANGLGGTAIAPKAVKAFQDFKAKYYNDKEKENPTADSLPVAVGVLYLVDPNKNPDEAIKYLQEALTMYPKGRFIQTALLQISEAYRLKGNPGEARGFIEKVLKENNDPTLVRTATLSMAQLIREEAQKAEPKDMAKLDEAIAKMRSLIKDFPNSSEAEQAWLMLIESLMEKKDFAEAAKEARGYADKYPDGKRTALVLQYRGTCLRNTNDVEGAKQNYREIIQKFPDSPEASSAYLTISYIEANAKNYPESVKVLEEFATAKPQDEKISKAYWMMADALEQIKPAPDKPLEGPSGAEQAMAKLEEFLQKYPKREEAPDMLGRIIDIREKQLKKLGGSYNVLPDDRKALWDKEGAAIISDSERLIDTYPDSKQVSAAISAILGVQRALVTAQKMKSDDIVAYFEKLRDKYGGNTQLRSKISFALAGYLMPIDASRANAIMKAAYDPSLKYSPGNMETYGKILLKSDDLEKANAVYEKVMADYSSDRGPTKKEAEQVYIVGKANIAFKKGDTVETDKRVAEFQALKTGPIPREAEVLLILLERARKDKKKEDIIKYAQELARHPKAEPEVKAQALFIAAEMFERDGKFAEAADNYRKIPAHYGAVIDVSSEALFRAGGLLVDKVAPAEQDKDKKKLILQNAKKAFQLIIDNYGATKWADQAQQRKSGLP